MENIDHALATIEIATATAESATNPIDAYAAVWVAEKEFERVVAARDDQERVAALLERAWVAAVNRAWVASGCRESVYKPPFDAEDRKNKAFGELTQAYRKTERAWSCVNCAREAALKARAAWPDGDEKDALYDALNLFADLRCAEAELAEALDTLTAALCSRSYNECKADYELKLAAKVEARKAVEASPVCVKLIQRREELRSSALAKALSGSHVNIATALGEATQ